MNLKISLDEYVSSYETEDFIKDDPVQFPRRFNDKKDVEIAGFLAAVMAYGRRELFIEKLSHMFAIMNQQPHNYILNFNEANQDFDDFKYRFSKGIDFKQLFLILKELYSTENSLEKLFAYSYNSTGSVEGMFQGIVDYFYSRVTLPVTQGFYFLLPDPRKGSAMKRLNMMMRWFVRDGAVDLGIWDFIEKSELLIPLDTHVAKISRKLGLLNRSSNDMRAVIELTKVLKDIDLDDPIKYDFALFGYGVNNKL
ncbi:MAG: TIGR02757 family protein [Candidatus Gastranaerophilales bacterium]|nr:TIGR02757 family protein [Candidatus Gastranaerophilales bacterium]